MLNKTVKTLDFDKILEMVSQYALTNEAKTAIVNLRPIFEYEKIDENQLLTQEAVTVKTKYLIEPVLAIDNVKEILSKNKIGITLQMGELLKIARVIKSAAYAKDKILSTGEDVVLLKNSVATLFADLKLEKEITDCIISETEMSDNASYALKSIRRTIANVNIKLKDKLNSYTKNNSASDYLQDNLYTVRNNRFVLPVKSECRGQVPGLIHDQSASGSTVFIEPFAIVELNNSLRTALAEEAAEIERILTDLSGKVYERLDSIAHCQEVVTMLDVIFAKAEFSLKIRGIRPVLSRNHATKLTTCRHPLIDKKKVVPIDIELGTDFNVLVITGPNTGGKTVSMKTLGLFCLMTYVGIQLPCAEATVAVYDNIFCDIGDEQSISNELSTFSSHIVNIIDITNGITSKSLVLFDELGGGTDPSEGAALAIGVIRYIETVGCCAIVSTHYDKLKEYALSSGKIMNGCMLFDEATLMPAYKLVIGMPGSSNAIKIAKGLGLNQFILDEAVKNIDEHKIQYERIIRNAENIKNEALKEREEAEKIRQDFEKLKSELDKEKAKLDAALTKIQSNASAEVKRIVSAKVAKAERIIEEMKALQAQETEKALLQARIKRNELSDLEYRLNEDEKIVYLDIDASKIEKGDEVIVKSLNLKGVVVDLPNKKGEVRVKTGAITTMVKTNDLAVAPIEKKTAPKKGDKKISVSSPKPVVNTLTPEIMVLGKTVMEAIEEIEPYFISLSGSGQIVRVVHGKGTMALAKGLHAYFKTCPLVANFRFGRYGEGDNGVTIVTLK